MTPNINRDQIYKFHRDLEYTGIKYGIFVSNTSGIVGKYKYRLGQKTID